MYILVRHNCTFSHLVYTAFFPNVIGSIVDPVKACISDSSLGANRYDNRQALFTCKSVAQLLGRMSSHVSSV